jgi:integrase
MAIEPHRAKVRGKEQWYLNIPSALTGGKQKRKFFDTRKEAEGHARQLEDDMRGLNSGFHRLPEADRATLLQILSKFTVQEIEKACESFAPRRNLVARLLPDVVQECLGAKASAGLRPRSLSSLKCTLVNFSRCHRDLEIGKVEASHIEQWLMSNGWSARTRKGYLTDLRTLFSFALKRHYCISNPALAVEAPILEDRPPGILNVAQVQILLAHALERDPALIPFIAVQVFGGLRPIEAERLDWSYIKEDHIEVTAAKSKTRRRRLVTLNPTLKAWLALKGELPVVNLKRRFWRLRYILSENKKKWIEVVPWTHDCLRHSFCSYHLAMYQNADKTAFEAGHSAQILFQHYRELISKEDAQKFWGIVPK